MPCSATSGCCTHIGLSTYAAGRSLQPWSIAACAAEGNAAGYLPKGAAGGGMRRLQLLRPFSSEKELEDGEHGRQRAEEVRNGSQGAVM